MNLKSRRQGLQFRLLALVLSVLGVVHATPARAANELAERQTVSNAARDAFLSSDFRALEEQAAAYRSSKSRTASGIWKLTLFYVGIRAGILATPADGGFSVLHASMKRKEWLARFPDSATAHVVHAMVSIEEGWKARGSGYASTVSPEEFQVFDQFIEVARLDLEKFKAVASADPKWYELMLIIARAQGWDRRRFDAVLAEGLDREPAYYETYFSALQYLLPKWHGDEAAIDAFVEMAVKRTAKNEGAGMYARIYWNASQTQYKNALFSGSKVTWPKLKEGFEAVIARYPDPWNLSNYAKFACLAEDKAKTRELFAALGTRMVPEAWTPPLLRERCAGWAGG